MSAPRNRWSPPPRSAPYGQPPVPPGPPPGPPAQAPARGVPPPPRQRELRDRGGLAAGLVVISIGLFFLAAQYVPDIGRYVVLVIGLIFLAAFVVKRDYGFLIPGCIISGVGLGVVLASLLGDPWSGASVLFSIAGGFLAIWIISTLVHSVDPNWPDGDSKEAAKALWWPLIPGGILAVIGLFVLAEDGFGSDLLRWWPLLIIGAGLIILASSLRRRR